MGEYGLRALWLVLTLKTCSSLPHRAVYITLTMTSVGSSIWGMGRSSTATTCGSLKTTALIVPFAILYSGRFSALLDDKTRLHAR